MSIRKHALRVHVPEPLLALPETTGHGRMWRTVLRELDAMDGVRVEGEREGHRVRRGVWLLDGHAHVAEAPLPVVAQIHEAPWAEPELRAQLDEGFAAAFERRTSDAAAHADRVVTGARRMVGQIAAGHGVPEDRIHVVAHGVDSARFHPGGAEAGRRRVGAPYVLFCGSLSPRKNLPALREAMARLAAEGLPHRLVVVLSAAPDRADQSALHAAAVAELPGAPGRLVRVDRPTDDDLAALMAGADACCLPSLWEGFGLPALEAMACGAPVVVSDRGALPEVVGDAGIVAAATPEGLTAALGPLLRHESRRDALRAAGRRRALERSWERCAQGWRAVLERAASEATGREGTRAAGWRWAG